MTTATKRACIVGWPVEHSRSPMIHGHWLAKYRIDGAYTKAAVKPEDARTFFRSLAANGLAGCNVTVPHKEAAFAAADELDGSAVAVGAANTLWLEGGRLHAANSDTYGFMTHLGEGAPRWRDRDAPVVILGAGGSARTIVYGFLEAGVGEIRIANRTFDRAEAVARHFGAKVKPVAWADRHAACARAGVLVNTTTLGMPKSGPLDLDVAALPPFATVADIVYVPLETALLRNARARGLAAVDGLGMLLHQAVPGFEKWFGVRPVVTPELRQIIVRDIEGT
jgi:shikimate dehydrogenase